MLTFKYKVVDAKSGAAREVLIEADSEPDSLIRLRARGFTPVKLISRMKDGGGSLFGSQSRQNRKFDQTAFTDRLLPLLKAQIQLERALSIIAESSEEGALRDVTMDLRRGLHEGKKFSTLIRDKAGCFSPIYANMVEAGEEAGALTNVMEELRNFLVERRELRTFLATSMIYPAFILSVTFGVIILLFTVFIPKFSKIFLDMGRELPLPTRVMMGISSFVSNPVFILCAVACLIGVFYFFAKVRSGGPAKKWWDEFLLKVPLVSSLLRSIEIARFVRTLAVLLQSNVQILNAVAIARKVIQNLSINDSLNDVTSDLKAGRKLSFTLAKSPFVSKIVIQMLGIGEETGNMGGMLAETASYYEREVKNTIKKLLAFFEPAIILILAVVVAAVVSSIFLAMLELNNI